MKRAIVITASDGVSAGVREDASGVEVEERLEGSRIHGRAFGVAG